jgi:predicted aldo/keto reductase-like oxidoreductase
MNFSEPTTFGRTGLKVGRLGISSSYGAPASAYEEAFDRGCNYFTWGTFIRGRSSRMKQAIKNIIAKGNRDKLVLSFITYAHNNFLTETFLLKGLKTLGIDYVDGLILGYFPKKPKRKTIEGTLRLKEKNLVRFLALSSHHRSVFPELVKDGLIDVFHIRYNAAHRGAERDTFPYIRRENGPGVVSFTATRWGQLLNPKKMPSGEEPATATDCYRFVLTHPTVDVCMVGARNIEQMRKNLKTLEMGPMNEEELIRMRKIGDYLYKK